MLADTKSLPFDCYIQSKSLFLHELVEKNMLKKFFKYTFWATVSMLIAIFLTTIIVGAIIMSSVLPAEKTPIPGPYAMLEININGTLPERVHSDPLDELLGNEIPQMGLDVALRAIREAKDNEKIKAIYLKGGILQASPASLEELRNALLNFKKSRKPIYAYADVYSQGAYYVCSVADSVYLNSRGQVDWHGLSSEPIFLKDALGKLGIQMQVFKKGTYKSAVEPFTSTQMSEANREQVSSYLQSIWSKMVADVSSSRAISKDSLNFYADQLTTFLPGKEMVRTGFVDELIYLDEMRAKLKQAVGANEKEGVQFLSPQQLVALANARQTDVSDQIAIYYAHGDIVSSSVESIYSNATIDARKVIRDLDKLGKDKQVKAVVLRINSGGGSAYASEQIWYAVQQLNALKPVIVSMGGMAASGAYYLACGSNYLMAEPTTLTGSIGIFGMFPDASELLTEKIGLHFDGVKTNKHADYGNIGRSMNSDEKAILQRYIEEGYDLFINRVKDGRKMSVAQVESLAEGRVWTGIQAKKNGLVDALGGLDDAVRIAAQRAQTTQYKRAYYPEEKPWYEQLIGQSRNRFLENKVKESVGAYFPLLQTLESIEKQDPIQARIPYLPNIR